MNPLYRACEVEFVLAKARRRGLLRPAREPRREPLGHRRRGGGAGARPRAPAACRSATRRTRPGPSWDEWLRGRRRVDEDRARAPPRRGAARGHLADPVHLGHHRLPQGRRAEPRRDRQQRPPLRPPGDICEHGRHCNPMPYFHCGGCVMATLGIDRHRLGAAARAHLRRRRGSSRTIEAERRTSASLVPTMMIALEEEVAAATAATLSRSSSWSPAARRYRRRSSAAGSSATASSITTPTG